MSVLCPLSSTGRWLSCWGSPRWLSVYWHSSVPVIWCPESALPNPSNLNDCPWRAYICRHGLCISVMISVPTGHKFIFLYRLLFWLVGERVLCYSRWMFRSIWWNLYSSQWNLRSVLWNLHSGLWNGKIIAVKMFLYALFWMDNPNFLKKFVKSLWCKNFFLYLSVKIYSWEFNLFNMCLI